MELQITTNIDAVIETFRRRVLTLPERLEVALDQGSRILERNVRGFVPSRTGRMRRSIFRQVTKRGGDSVARVGVTHPAAKALEGGAYIRANAAGALAIPMRRGLPAARALRAAPSAYGYVRTFAAKNRVFGVTLLRGVEALYALLPAVRIRAKRFMARGRRRSMRDLKHLLRVETVRTLRGGS